MIGEPPAAVTPTVARQLLASHGLAPRKAAGQHFVVDPNTVERIVAAAGITPDDEVLEIGPGLGSLTLPLARVARRVVAVEIDAGLASVVAELTAPLGNVEVVHGDALDEDFDAWFGGPVRVVANLPYHLATPMLFAVLQAGRPVDAYLMVQREVGQRWVARPGDPQYGGVSVRLAFAAQARIDLAVPRSVFLPIPNVDSVMVRITRRVNGTTSDERRWMTRVVDVAFAQRRKTLRNNLRAAFGEAGIAGLLAVDIDPAARAETLGVDEFAALADALWELV